MAKRLRILGMGRMAKIGAGYVKARLFPIKDEKSLEDFLYQSFWARTIPDLF
jgi:hypothetical protein